MVDDPLHILIVDDEPGCRETLSLLLGTDHDVETAADGREALEELDGTVDIVLLDREMPGHLASRWPTGPSPPSSTPTW